MYFRAKRRNCFSPHLFVFLDADTVAFSNKRAAVDASENSARISPNNLKSGTGPTHVKKRMINRSF